MNERRAVVGAVTVGLSALVGLSVLSSRRNSLAPRLLSVRVVPAVDRRPAFVEIGIEPSPSLLHLGKEGESWEYRVVDASGRTYVVAPNSDEHTRSLRLPYAYGRPAVDPHVEVWLEETKRASTSLGSLPPPLVSRMNVEPSAPIRAFHLSTTERRLVPQTPGQPGGIRLVPRSPILPKERWIVTVVQTPLQARAYSQAEYASYPTRLNSGPTPVVARQAVALLPYADDVTAVRVRVRRLLHRTRSERVLVSGLRLVKRSGQTTLVCGASHIPNTLGIDLRIDPRVPGHFWTDPAKGDGRVPLLPLKTLGSNDARNLSWTDPWVDNAVLMTIEGPDLDHLNVHHLGIGDADWKGKKIAGPVYTGPFSVVLTVTKQWDENLGTFEATVPVEPAQTR